MLNTDIPLPSIAPVCIWPGALKLESNIPWPTTAKTQGMSSWRRARVAKNSPFITFGGNQNLNTFKKHTHTHNKTTHKSYQEMNSDEVLIER